MDASHRNSSRTSTRGACLAAGLASALVAAVWFGAGSGAALPGPDESTLVPVVPCRLMDTRPDPNFNTGPRATPLGDGETHELAVTGAQGDCDVPDDATAVALNVTAVDPTTASYLTLFPADAAERPTASNLNFTAGAAPTPNKVDVRLSPDGELGVFNAFGEVHVVIDVTGYYTADGLHDLVAALGEKADASDVYTKAEIDVRTQTRTISFPAQALNLPGGPVVTEDGFGIVWDHDNNPGIHLALARPSDWTGTSPVTLRVFFTRTPSPHDVWLSLGVRSFDPGDATNTLVIAQHIGPQTAEGQNVAHEIAGELKPADLQGSWWDISISRVKGAPPEYVDPMFVRAIALEYEAHT